MMKNFTVIGNVLFIHILFGPAAKDSAIAEIPPMIFSRLLQGSVFGILQSTAGALDSSGFSWGCKIKSINGRHYITTSGEVTVKYVFTAYLFLKDI